MGGVRYDPEVDILYVLLVTPTLRERARSTTCASVDYDAANAIVGVEFVNAMSGINLAGVPDGEVVKRLIDESGLELPRR